MMRARQFSETIALAATIWTLAGCSNRATPDTPAAVTPTLPLPTIAAVVAPTPLEGTGSESATGAVLVESYRGDVQPQAEAIFGLTGDVGDAIRIEVQVRLGTPDLVLDLSTPSGQALASVDVGGPGQSEVIGDFRLPASGYYELGVKSLSDSGQVDVLIYRLPADNQSGGGTIPGFDQPVSGQMERPATFHTYQIEVERGQRFDLWANAQSGDLDLLFELYGPQGEPLAARDDSLSFDPYLMNYMPSTSGAYTLVLTNYEDTTGTYQIRAARSESSGQLDFGQQQLVSLPTEPASGAWLTLVGVAGEGLRLNADPIAPGIDLTLALYDVFGNRLAFANLGGPGVREILSGVQFPYDGPFQLEFGTLTEGGEVRFDALPRTQFDFETNGPPLSFPSTREVELLETGTAHAFWFDGESGQRVTIDVSTTVGTPDLAFDLLDQAGGLLSSHDDDRERDPVLENYVLPYTGRYFLVVRAENNHRGGAYRLRTDSPAPPDLVPAS